MNGPVIVPLDGSKLAEQALPLALSIAQHAKGGELLLLRALKVPASTIRVAPNTLMTIDEQTRLLENSAQAYLAEVAEQLKSAGVTINVETHIGRADEIIAYEADKREGSIIVMSTHGRTGFSRWALGSVTDHVLHLTERPLIVLRPQEILPLTPHHLPEIKRIVVPLERLPLAKEVLPYVQQLAEAYSGTEILLFCAIPAFPAGSAELEAIMLKDSWHQSCRAETESYLGGIVKELREHGHQVDFAIKIGAAANKILDYANEVKADLIVMATHTRQELSYFLLGSVTDRVIRAGQVPVMAVRPASN
jgi:nucleotide-binding universal stress UspA family protein